MGWPIDRSTAGGLIRMERPPDRAVGSAAMKKLLVLVVVVVLAALAVKKLQDA